MNYVDVYAIPVAMILGYLLFYAPVSIWHSYRSIETNFWKFEKTAFIPACVGFAFSSLVIIALQFYIAP